MPCCRKEIRKEVQKLQTNTCRIETSSVISGPVSLEPLSRLTQTQDKK